MEVLIAEDDAMSRRQLEFALAKLGWAVVAASDGAEALAALRRPDAPPLLAILDVMMPKLSGIEVCQQIRRTPCLAPPYIILLTSKSGKNDVVAGLRAGANDYIIKPFDREELSARVEVGAQLLRLQQSLAERTRQLEAANEALRLLSSLDGLTGIANRRHFDEFLDREWRRAVRAADPLTLVLMDVDFFKHYNDACGHQSGDDCLRGVANAVGGVYKRPGDLVARYGGEEFVGVFYGADEKEAPHMAETFRRLVEELRLPHPASAVSQFITISAGVATARPTLSQSPGELIAAADKALFQAKRDGRNRVRVSPQSGHTLTGPVEAAVKGNQLI